MINQRRLAMTTLVFQAGIVFTGSIVRVTGSGLGCPTWPDCQPGSLIPVAGARPAIHQAIEWGNRLLTFVVAAAAIALVISVFKGRRRSSIKTLAIVQIVGVVVQAIIGGLSVLLQLPWWAVALHFLPSMILVFLAAVLWVKIAEPDAGTPTQMYPEPLAKLASFTAFILLVVLSTGTMVTGAGEHAGDAEAGQSGRLGIDLAYMAQIHAHFMYLYLGLTVGLIVALFTVKARAKTIRFGWTLVVLTIIQGAIGIIQFNFGVPRWTVPFHVVLSGIVTAYMGILWARGRQLRATESAAAYTLPETQETR